MLKNLKTDKSPGIVLGKNNQECQYELGGILLKETKEEKNLGMLVNEKTKPTRQCVEASNKGNSLWA